MAGLNARGLQSKLLITPLIVSEAIIIIIINLQVWCGLKSLHVYTLGLATVVIALGNLASFPSYSCLVYMILYAVLLLISLLFNYIIIYMH